MDIERFLFGQLIYSRIFLLIFQCFINRLVIDFPTDAFKGISLKRLGISDDFVQYTLEGLSRWDARHFLHNAEFGYTWEGCLAFFPFFPTVLRGLGTLLQSIFFPISLQSAMLLSGVLLNNTLFVVDGLILFRLVMRLTNGNLKQSLICIYIFCWNPSSIFFTALYSEPLYFFFTLTGILVLHEAPRRWTYQLMASFIFSFAFLTRSNGILNFGYIGYYVLLDICFRRSKSGSLSFEEPNIILLKSFKKLPFLFVCLCTMCLPLRVFSTVVEEKFCSTRPIHNERIKNFLDSNSTMNMILPGDLLNLDWCSQNRSLSILMPSYYRHVQRKYWNVSFMGYWHLRKFPCFLLAAPALIIVFYGVWNMFSRLISSTNSKFEDRLADVRLLVPFAIHAMVIAITGLLVYNVEVSTRLLFSASPFIYIVLARQMDAQTPAVHVPEDIIVPSLLPFLSIYGRVRLSHAIVLFYLLAYYFFGTLVHVNWGPFV